MCASSVGGDVDVVGMGLEALEAIMESGEDIATTSINLHEILYGLEKYARPVKDVLLLPALPCDKRDA